MAGSAGGFRINWRNYLNEQYSDVPLHALKSITLKRLGLFLDQELDAVDMDAEVMRDFTGLADLIGFDNLEIQMFERAEQKGKKVLQEWMNRTHPRPTVGKLVEFLAIMDREDILGDLGARIQNDAKDFVENKEKLRPVQVGEVTPGPGEEEEPEHITVEDVVMGTKMTYDAFVCYNPAADGSEDTKFVKELIQRLEGPPYNFRLFVPQRNDLIGLNRHSISAKIISERCRHMIVVLSNNFLQSPACDFQAAFAHAMSPGARSKRMVPVRLEEVAVPNIMRIMAMCDFTKRDLRDWSWVRLAQSIRVPLAQADLELQNLPSGMLPVETIWGRPAQHSSSPMHVQPVTPDRHASSFPESGFSSMPGPSSHNSALPELPCDKAYTAPIAKRSSGFESFTSTPKSSTVAVKDHLKNKSSSDPNLAGDANKGKKKGFVQRLRDIGKKKEPRAEVAMETNL